MTDFVRAEPQLGNALKGTECYYVTLNELLFSHNFYLFNILPAETENIPN